MLKLVKYSQSYGLNEVCDSIVISRACPQKGLFYLIEDELQRRW